MRLAGALLLEAILVTMELSSCGGGGGGGGTTGSTGTPAGTYTLDVTATFTSASTTLTHDIKLALNVN